MKYLKPFNESFTKSDADDLLIDIKSDFEHVNFYGYERRMDKSQAVDGVWGPVCDVKGDAKKYQLRISLHSVNGDSATFPGNPKPWSEIRPYIEEFVERAEDRGLHLDHCEIFLEVKEGTKTKSWSTFKFGKIPSPEKIGLVGRVEVDFTTDEVKPKPTLLQKFKDLF